MRSTYANTILLISICIFHSCKKVNDPKSETYQGVNIDGTSIILGGVSYGDKILESGICWSEYTDPTIKANKVAISKGEGSYSTVISGLTPGKTYHVRAYCASRLKLSYGEDMAFSTLSNASVTTSFPNQITQNSFACSGIVQSNGYTLISCGICWNTSPNPTINNFKNSDALVGGAFTSNISGLDSNSTYYYRAYAIFNLDTVYGNENTVKTYTSKVVDVDGNMYYTVTIGSQVWMASNLKVTHYRNGDPINLIGYASWPSNYSTGNYGNYNDNPANSVTLGCFYNGQALNDPRFVAPLGWHVPDVTEWNTLGMTLGGLSVAGNKLKSVEFGGSNSSSFNALAAGERSFDTDSYKDTLTYLYSSTPSYVYELSIFSSALTQVGSNFIIPGYSIRCIKD